MLIITQLLKEKMHALCGPKLDKQTDKQKAQPSLNTIELTHLKIVQNKFQETGLDKFLSTFQV